MIERAAFKQAWGHLCTRFGRSDDPAQAVQYFDYLSEQMGTDEFLRAARAVWATARYFPRPADFLLIAAADEWMLVLRCIEGFRGPDWPWREPWERLSKRAQDACNLLGGMEALKGAAARDPLRLKAAWEAAYEQAAASAVLALPAPAGPPPSLTPGDAPGEADPEPVPAARAPTLAEIRGWSIRVAEGRAASTVGSF